MAQETGSQAVGFRFRGLVVVFDSKDDDIKKDNPIVSLCSYSPQGAVITAVVAV